LPNSTIIILTSKLGGFHKNWESGSYQPDMITQMLVLLQWFIWASTHTATSHSIATAAIRTALKHESTVYQHHFHQCKLTAIKYDTHK